jgi:hypothetical protein
MLLLPSVDAPSGSFEETKSTGSCMLGSCMLNVVQAMEWEDPQATRFTCTSSKPCTGAGLRFTMVVPLPCCPWSLSPHANTYVMKYIKHLSSSSTFLYPDGSASFILTEHTWPVSETARQWSAPTAT